ncbi:hypothetical protein KY330_01750 [Candidatus Woesearchaeota archaeon]|nr:hypothetical protein [Candidatus Woesearchaeota archaeon]
MYNSLEQCLKDYIIKPIARSLFGDYETQEIVFRRMRYYVAINNPGIERLIE